MHRGFWYCAALVALVAAPALADPGDPPARVARLNYISGNVSFRPGTVEDWTEASLNFPLTTGDHLWTEQASQTEIHVGSAVLRMGQTTALAILNLDDNVVQFSLTEGTINLRVRDLDPDEVYEIDTPNAAIAILRPGSYRIDTMSDRNTTWVTVWDGEADVTGSRGTFPVRFGRRMQVAGDGPGSQQTVDAPAPADFDRWCLARDRREEQSQSARYVSRQTTGYEDLDQYGSWRPMPDYGSVWVPAGMPGGWAPYRDGRWAWVDPWGWTWIDDAPWGFAPYHYGRWAYSGPVGWFWVPGPMAPHPVYAPALVAFVGGARLGVGVGWFPLGPGEIYRPGYRVSDRYARRLNGPEANIANFNIANARYANRDAPGAFTMVPRDTFVGARPVRGAAMTVDSRMIARGEIVGMAPPVAPTRVSVMGRPDGRRMAVPPPRLVERPVIARTAPPAPPVSFQARERALDANPGRPLDPGQMDNLRRNAPRTAPAVQTMQAPQGGFRRPMAADTAAPRQDASPARGTPGPDPGNRQPARGGAELPPATSPAAAPRQEQPRTFPQRPADQRNVEQLPQTAPAPQPRQERPAQAAPVPQPRQERPAQAAPVPQPSPDRPAQAAPVPQPRQDRPAQVAPVPQPRQERPAQAAPVPQPSQERPAQAAPVPQPRQERPAQAAPVPQPSQERPAQAAPVPQPRQDRPAQAAPTPQPRQERPAQTAPVPQPRQERPAQAAPRSRPEPEKKKDEDKK